MSNDDVQPQGGSIGGRRTSRPQYDDLGPVSDSYIPPTGQALPPPAGSTPDSETQGPPAAPLVVKKSGNSAIREIVETLLLAFVIFVGVRLLVLNFRVDGSSMVPNLHNEEMLLVNRNVYFHFDLNRLINIVPGEDRDGKRVVYPFHPPQRGDIIVFNPPTVSDKPYIKRVIGLAGETVEVHDGAVFINGEKLPEPYIENGITECNQAACKPWVIPDGSIFVMGDNRKNSSDSRIFGPVRINSIIGKAWITYWPFSDFGLVPHHDYPGIKD